MCIIFQKGTESAGRYFGGEQDLSATGTSRAVLGCNFPESSRMEREKGRQLDRVHLLQLEDCYSNTHLSIEILVCLNR